MGLDSLAGGPHTLPLWDSVYTQGGPWESKRLRLLHIATDGSLFLSNLQPMRTGGWEAVGLAPKRRPSTGAPGGGLDLEPRQCGHHRSVHACTSAKHPATLPLSLEEALCFALASLSVSLCL